MFFFNIAKNTVEESSCCWKRETEFVLCFFLQAARYEKDKPVHSLTARSISKQMKETLKGDSSIHNGNSFFKQTLAMMLMI